MADEPAKDEKPAVPPAEPAPATEEKKKKLSLDVTEVDEVLERKISP